MLKNILIKNNVRKRFNNNNYLNILIEIESIFYKIIQFFFKFDFSYIMIELVNYTLK